MAKPISLAQSNSIPSRQLQYMSIQLIRGMVKNQPIMPLNPATISIIVQKSNWDSLLTFSSALQYT